jgi:hypothetical protein
MGGTPLSREVDKKGLDISPDQLVGQFKILLSAIAQTAKENSNGFEVLFRSGLAESGFHTV